MNTSHKTRWALLLAIVVALVIVVSSLLIIGAPATKEQECHFLWKINQSSCSI